MGRLVAHGVRKPRVASLLRPRLGKTVFSLDRLNMPVNHDTVALAGNDVPGGSIMEAGDDIGELAVGTVGAGGNIVFAFEDVHLIECLGAAEDHLETGVVEPNRVVTGLNEGPLVGEDKRVGGIFDLHGLLNDAGSLGAPAGLGA